MPAWKTIHKCNTPAEANTLINKLRRNRTDDRPLRRWNSNHIQRLDGIEPPYAAARDILMRPKPYKPK